MTEYQKEALQQLILFQTQLDEDVIAVSVSREALDVVLDWVTMQLSTMEGSKKNV